MSNILVFDTNILIELARADARRNILFRKVNPDNHKVYISIVSIGEAMAFGYTSGWGIRKIELLESIINDFIVINLSDAIVQKYIEIEQYNRNMHPILPKMNGNKQDMGKNDLWIASTTSVLEATLVTTDKDFNHLSGFFFELDYLERDDNGSFIY